MVLNNYYIGDLIFKSKKQCETYTRDLIKQLGCCIIDKDHMYYNFFDNLLKSHSEYEIKKGIGIESFIIRIDPIFKKSYQMAINRIDGSEIIFSWVYCCQFKPRTTSENLIRAMRNTISIDTIKYKRSQDELICNYCKTTDEAYENYHVDHDNPSFKTLKHNFLQTTKLQIPVLFGDSKINNLLCFKDEDIEFKNQWYEYHKRNSTFQILCKKCNSRKQ